MNVGYLKHRFISFSGELPLILLHLHAYLTWFDYEGVDLLIISMVLLFALIPVSKYSSFSAFEIAFIFIFLISIFVFSGASSFNGFYVFFQICFTFFLIIFFSAYLAAGKAKNLIIYISFNLVFLFLQWVDVGGNFKVWLLPNMNPNVMGFFVCLNLLLLIYFVGSRCGLILKSISLLLIPLAFFLIFVSTARSIWLALAICLIIYTVMQSLISNRSIFNVLAFLVTFLLLFFPHIYIYLSESTLGIQIDTFVSDVTNKRFFTGREVIWQEMYKGLGDSVFFGMGMGATNSDIGLRSSSHNLYMSFFFQFGVVGVAFFLLSFFLVIKNAVRNLDAYMGYKNRNICFKCTSLMGALLISLLVQQSFELFLFQNNLPASFLFWCGLVLYYSQTYKSYRK